MSKPKNPHAVALGNITKRKYGRKHYVKAGKLGGKPRKYPPCPSYNNKSHRFNKLGVCYACGYDRKNPEESS
jgi:hypothetical protein